MSPHIGDTRPASDGGAASSFSSRRSPFRLRALIHRMIDADPSFDPQVLARRVANAIPAQHRRDALVEALPWLIRKLAARRLVNVVESSTSLDGPLLDRSATRTPSRSRRRDSHPGDAGGPVEQKSTNKEERP